MTASPLGDLPPTLWFCRPGPVDINIAAKCNACLSGPCKNNGTCSQDPVERYRCACPYGYKVRRETPAPPLTLPRPRAAWRTPLHRLPPKQYLPVTLPCYWWGCPVASYSHHAQRTPQVRRKCNICTFFVKHGEIKFQRVKVLPSRASINPCSWLLAQGGFWTLPHLRNSPLGVSPA